MLSTKLAKTNFRRLSLAKQKFVEYLQIPENVDQTVTDICKELGISRETYYTWMEDPSVREALKEKAFETYAKCLPKLVRSLVKRAVEGDHKAQSMILQMIGLYNPRVASQAVNIGINQPQSPEITAETPEELVKYIDQQMQRLREIRARLTGGVLEEPQLQEAY